MPTLRSLALLLAGAVLGCLAISALHAQAPTPSASFVRILGLGLQGTLPTRSDGAPVLPVRTEDRQASFTAEQWQNSGADIAPLLYNSSVMPRQVVLCGHKLTMIQGSLVNTPADESNFFPLTVNGTRLSVPDDGCYTITPVAYLRIKSIMKIPREQMTNVVSATY